MGFYLPWLYSILNKQTKEKKMKYETAMKILKKEMDFLGLTLEELLIFSARNPLTVPRKVVEAIGAYKKNSGACFIPKYKVGF